MLHNMYACFFVGSLKICSLNLYSLTYICWYQFCLQQFVCTDLASCVVLYKLSAYCINKLHFILGYLQDNPFSRQWGLKSQPVPSASMFSRTYRSCSTIYAEIKVSSKNYEYIICCHFREYVTGYIVHTVLQSSISWSMHNP